MVQTIPTGGFNFLSIFRYIWKHKFLFLFLMFTLPLVYHSIDNAIQTKNPISPFLELAGSILTADNQLAEKVTILNSDPSQLFGTKPETGIYRTFLFYLNMILVSYNILGLIYLIFTPFLVLYVILSWRNDSEKAKNVLISIGIFVTYLFIVNLLYTIYGLATGSMTFIIPEGSSEFQKIYLIVLKLLPFNGLISLAKYLFWLIF